MEAAVQRLNTELEQRVVERTSALADSNRELEAFGYSISHDLRSPLRAIDGFSFTLLEEAGPQLDETNRSYLERIRAAAQRMGLLIDDIQRLSRLTRSVMTHTRIDLSAMAKTLAEGLTATAPARSVEWVIASDLTAEGDAGLLEIALGNLLSNAFKFTSAHPTARIELGTTQIDGRQVFFVRDDGAGFDMIHADKLFTPFQRFHTADEFEGSGIGLATVQRIVHRHGGNVWAESAVEKGTTVYFTLGSGALPAQTAEQDVLL